jgi:hypothetical protein
MVWTHWVGIKKKEEDKVRLTDVVGYCVSKGLDTLMYAKSLKRLKQAF